MLIWIWIFRNVNKFFPRSEAMGQQLDQYAG